MIKQKYFNNLIAAVVMMLVLNACGFHLRGNIPLPDELKNMFVKAPDGTFEESMEDVLENAGAVLAANQAGADVILNIVTAQTKRTVGTLDDRGKANSYNFLFTVKYELLNAEGFVVRTASLTESRRYNFNPELILESESEEADLQEDMEQDIALRIVRQLSSITSIASGKKSDKQDQQKNADKDRQPSSK